MRSLGAYLDQVEDVPDRVNLQARLRSMSQALDERQQREAALEEQANQPPPPAPVPVDESVIWPWIMAAGGALVAGGVVRAVSRSTMRASSSPTARTRLQRHRRVGLAAQHHPHARHHHRRAPLRRRRRRHHRPDPRPGPQRGSDSQDQPRSTRCAVRPAAPPASERGSDDPQACCPLTHGRLLGGCTLIVDGQVDGITANAVPDMDLHLETWTRTSASSPRCG